MTPKVELNPRIVLAQKRAEKTVRHILDISAELLDEVGLDGFNTNLLANRAGIRVATIYRYFPNKLAILSALVQRWLELVVEGMTFTSDLSNPKQEWRVIFERVIDGYVDIALNQKGHLAIRRAVLAAPELVQIEARMIRKLSINIVNSLDSLDSLNQQYSKHHIFNFVEVFLTTTAQAVDMAVIKSQKRKEFLAEIITETKLLQTSYLANYLD
jgi:AcrR family transcriptional regulator